MLSTQSNESLAQVLRALLPPIASSFTDSISKVPKAMLKMFREDQRETDQRRLTNGTSGSSALIGSTECAPYKLHTLTAVVLSQGRVE